MAEIELKRCPFCGKTPGPDDHFVNQGNKWGGIQCCCEGPDVRTGYKDWPAWKSDAIEAWNTRAPAPEWAGETRKFKRGDRVRKISGSSWQGIVVGEYSTKLTPEGYDVESEREPGSVQLYPAKALELISETMSSGDVRKILRDGATKLHFTNEWLKEKIEQEPDDMVVEAGGFPAPEREEPSIRISPIFEDPSKPPLMMCPVCRKSVPTYRLRRHVDMDPLNRTGPLHFCGHDCEGDHAHIPEKPGTESDASMDVIHFDPSEAFAKDPEWVNAVEKISTPPVEDEPVGWRFLAKGAPDRREHWELRNFDPDFRASRAEAFYTEPLYSAETVDRLRADRDELQTKYDALTGERFSDRVHVALKFRAEEAETRLTTLRQEVVRECATVGYRICAETRHVTLGEKVDAAIRQLGGKSDGN